MSLQHAPRWLPLAPWLFLLTWSAGYGVAKLALQSTTPLNLLALRFFGATLVLLPIVLLVRPAWPSTSVLRDLLIITLLLQLGHFGCIYVGLALGASAGVLALFAASQPVLIAVVAAIFAHHRPPFRTWVGLAMGLGGAGWVIYSQGNLSEGVLIGSILGLVAVASLSLGQAYDKHRRPECHPLIFYVIQYGFASVVSVPLAWMIEGYQTLWTDDLVGALVYMVLGNSLFGIFMMLTMVRFGAMTHVTSIMFLVPAVAAVIAWWLVDEVMPLAAWPGVLVAVLGVALVIRAPSLPRPVQPE